jgi:peptide methionine sulfoxide reductase MsrA
LHLIDIVTMTGSATTALLFICVFINSALSFNHGLKNFQRHVTSFGDQFRKTTKAVACALPLALLISASPASAAEGTPFYFGVGCFWHVQHEFVKTEQSVMSRGDSEITSMAGYAGGTRVGAADAYGAIKTVKADSSIAKPVVCYHNMASRADYGQLGHGEVVQMTIPDKNFADFASEYFSLFGADNERPDKGDRGSEYRSLIGLPKGVKSELYPKLEALAMQKGIKLVEGKGNDADTLGKKQVWVMDSEVFPFYQGEIYHQFHDGFMPGESYPDTYNKMVKASLAAGTLKSSGCPEGMF